MKLNKVAVSALLTVAACGFAGAASAHTYAGTINANGGANRHDLLQTTCFSWGTVAVPGPHGLPPAGEIAGAATRLNAGLTGTGAGLTIQALPNGAAVTGNAVSSATQVAGSFPTPNNGVYFVKINRAVSGPAVSYTATLHCSTGALLTSPHTGTGEGFAGDIGAVLPGVDYNVLVNQ